MFSRRKVEQQNNSQGSGHAAGPDPKQFMQILIQVATDLYNDIGTPDGKASLRAELAFDAQFRVGKVANLQVNGVPKIPSHEVMEIINQQTSQFATMPEVHRPIGMKISIQDGRVDVQPEYSMS